jgi:hypothetical protein
MATTTFYPQRLLLVALVLVALSSILSLATDPRPGRGGRPGGRTGLRRVRGVLHLQPGHLVARRAQAACRC